MKMTEKINYAAMIPEERDRWKYIQDKLIKFVIRYYTFIVIGLYTCAPILVENAFPIRGSLPKSAYLFPWSV